jgi:hypothetical protein
LDFLFRLLHPRRVTGFISLLASLLLERNCFSLGGGQLLLRLLPGFGEVVVAALVKILKVELHVVPELALGGGFYHPLRVRGVAVSIFRAVAESPQAM